MTEIRMAAPEDLAFLAEIEADGDALFEEYFARPTNWDPPSSGEWRARQPGFLLVAVDDGRVIGFAHVLEQDGWCHLEQLCVLRDHQQRGHGRALVTAVQDEAAARGHGAVSLLTFTEVPWNAPFYVTCGFVETQPSDEFHLELVRRERELGLPSLGQRVLMVTRVDTPA